MKLALLFLTLIAFISSQSSDECSQFSVDVINGCEALSPSATSKCIYSENQCISGYTECSHYTPAAGSFVDLTCKNIIPSDSKYKCVVQGEGQSKTCSQELKSCSECSKIDDCTSLKAGEGQRCLLIENERCEAHYEECSSLTSQPNCEANIPKDNTKMCSWSDRACASVDRTCEKYISYYGPSNEFFKDCLNLKAISSPKICMFENDKTCGEEYGKCDDGDEDQTLCESIKPLNSDKNGYDHQNICKYTEEVPEDSDTTCTKRKKKCTEYIKGFDDEDDCLSLEASNANKLCSYDDSKDECSEIYKTCNSYNLVETVPNNRQKTTCEAITYRETNGNVNPLYECYFDEDAKSCKERKKSCSKLTESLCETQELDDSTKKCLFVNNECKEIYKTCLDYTTKVEARSRIKEDCEIIIYKDSRYHYIYNCTFDGIDNENKCEENLFQCEDYKGQDEDFCNSLSINIDASDSSALQCKLIEGRCIKQYRTCESYLGDSKKICESIPISSTLHKCILEHDKTCKTEQKACSEYTGKSESECRAYKASTDKVCGIVNGKCTEKSVSTPINYCSDYRGTSKEECESIQPFYTEGISSGQVDPSSRCVFKEEGCIKESKQCNDAKSELECSNINPPDDESNEKQCAFVNNACVEQFRTCDLYNRKEETTKFSQNGCESIVNNEANYPFSQYRCKYTAPSTGQTKGTCTRQKRICSEFRPELVKTQCSNISPTDVAKKCVFNNNDNSCTSESKTCLELETLASNPSDLDDICENASVSSDGKLCSAKEGGYGCHEIDKETNVPEDNPNGNNNNENSSGMNHLNKIVLILIYLLF